VLAQDIAKTSGCFFAHGYGVGSLHVLFECCTR